MITKLFSIAGITAISLVGCASVNTLNSPEHIQTLTSEFSAACQKNGGKLGIPKEQGAEAVCEKNGTNSSMYINSNFIVLNSLVPTTNTLMGDFQKVCVEVGGEFDSGFKMLNGRLTNTHPNKRYCKGKEWSAVHTFADDTKNTQLTATFARDSKGRVDQRHWDNAIKFTSLNGR